MLEHLKAPIVFVLAAALGTLTPVEAQALELAAPLSADVAAVCDAPGFSVPLGYECIFEWIGVGAAASAVAAAEVALAFAIVDGAPGDEFVAGLALAAALGFFAVAEGALFQCMGWAEE